MGKILRFIFFLFLFIPLLAQIREKEKSSQPILLRNADSLIGSKTEFGTIREFIGNVIFEQGSVVVRGDRAIHYIEENRAILYGNVVISQEDLTLYSEQINYYGSTGIAESPKGIKISDKNAILKADFGEYNTKTQIADFRDNVSVTDDTVTIISDTIKYFKKNRLSYAYGNVKIEDDSTLIFADMIEYDRNDRQSKAYGNVLVKAKTQLVYLLGDTILNYPPQRYTIATGKPYLIQIDTVDKREEDLELHSINLKGSSGAVLYKERYYLLKENNSLISFKLDTIIISADTMESFRSNNRELYYFKKNVQVYGSNLKGKADLVVYDRIKEDVELIGAPVIWYDSTQIVGDTLNVILSNKKIKEISAFGNAFTASREDTSNPTRINQIFGNRIIVSFNNDTINGVFSYGDAKSLYFLKNEDSAEGVSRYGCDSLFVEFSEGKAVKIHWLGSVVGEYIPENILIVSPEYYFLPNFKWVEKKPLKKFFKLKLL